MNDSNIYEEKVYEEIINNYYKYSEENENKRKILLSNLMDIDTIKFFIMLINKKEDNIFKYFLNQFAFEDNNIYIQTFWHCIKTSNIDIIQYFLQNNYIDIEDCKDDCNNSPLMLSVLYGHLLLSKVFISYCPILINVKNKVNTIRLIIIINNFYSIIYCL